MAFKLGEKIGGTVVPAGVYNARLDHWESAVTRERKLPMVKVRWRICDGEFAGQVLFDQFVVSEDAIFRACQVLSALGFPPDAEFENPKQCVSEMIKGLENDAVISLSVTKNQHPTDRTREVNNISMYSAMTSELGSGEEGEDDIKF